MGMKYDGKDIIWCHWDLIRFLQKKDLTEEKVIGVSGYRKTKEGKNVVLDYKIYMKKAEIYIRPIFLQRNKIRTSINSTVLASCKNLLITFLTIIQNTKKDLWNW